MVRGVCCRHELGQFARTMQFFHEMLAAKGNVAVVAANLYGCTFTDRATFSINTQVHCCLGAAFANCLQFMQFVGNGEKPFAALKQCGLEIGTQSVTKHRYLEDIGNGRQLKNMLFGEELGLVYKNTVDGACF